MLAKVLFANSGTTVINPNRYDVITKNVSDIVTTAGFDWSKVTSLKVYASLEASGTPTDDYAIVLDGLRFENIGTENPLYALTAYTVVNNTTASKIYKQEIATRVGYRQVSFYSCYTMRWRKRSNQKDRKQHSMPS